MKKRTKQDASVSSPGLTIKSKEETPPAVKHYHQILLYFLCVIVAIYGYLGLVKFVQTQKEIPRGHISIQTQNIIMFEKIILAGDEQNQVITPVIIQN